MKLSDLKPGDRVRCDFWVGDGETPCVPRDAVRVVRQDAAGLFVRCCGPADCREWQTHHLDGQEDDDGELIGVTRA
jgi:hypothetical protein